MSFCASSGASFDATMGIGFGVSAGASFSTSTGADSAAGCANCISGCSKPRGIPLPEAPPFLVLLLLYRGFIG